MDIIYLNSSELPNISTHIKISINSGGWMLFTSQEISHHQTYFYLKVDNHFYTLDKTGNILEFNQPISDNYSIDKIIYFSDLPMPDSLSNLSASYPKTLL
jgi:hypothetical protein